MTFYPDIYTKSPDQKFAPRELVTPGPHAARVVGIVDMGIQHNKDYDKYAEKVTLIVAFTDDIIETEGEFKGKMKHLSREFTRSDAELSGLYKDVFRPLNMKPDNQGHYNIVKLLLNVPIQVTVMHKEIVNKKGEKQLVDNIAGFSLLMKGIKVAESDVEPYVYSLANHVEETLKKVPAWLVKKINFASAGVNYVPETKEGKVNGDFTKE